MIYLMILCLNILDNYFHTFLHISMFFVNCFESKKPIKWHLHTRKNGWQGMALTEYNKQNQASLDCQNLIRIMIELIKIECFGHTHHQHVWQQNGNYSLCQ